MFFDSGLFWLLMGVFLILVAAAFQIFATERGWRVTWWKGILALAWYCLLGLLLYAFGTLAGENEASAGLRLLLFGLVICVILGLGLWRLMAPRPKPAEKPES